MTEREAKRRYEKLFLTNERYSNWHEYLREHEGVTIDEEPEEKPVRRENNNKKDEKQVRLSSSNYYSFSRSDY